nr:hypothetical protein [uncultured Campylobacter sp.]
MTILQGSSRSKTVRKFCQNESSCVSCKCKKAPKNRLGILEFLQKITRNSLENGNSSIVVLV